MCPEEIVDLPFARYVPINAASSTGRCNTLQYVDSIVLSQKNSSVWLYSVKNLARVVFRLI